MGDIASYSQMALIHSNKVEGGLGHNIAEEPYSYTEDGKGDLGGQGNGSNLLTLSQSSPEDISLHSSVLIEKRFFFGSIRN